MTLIAVAGVFVGEPTFECDWSVISAADVAWLITATIFVLMMTPGLSFFYGGMVGAKNVISTMLQSFIAMGLISVLWVVIGFSLCFGDDIGGVIGNPLTFPMFHGVGAEVYTPWKTWTTLPAPVLKSFLPLHTDSWTRVISLNLLLRLNQSFPRLQRDSLLAWTKAAEFSLHFPTLPFRFCALGTSQVQKKQKVQKRQVLRIRIPRKTAFT